MDSILGAQPSPRVFIVQEQFMRDPATNALVSKFDFSEAKNFGNLIFLLDSNTHPFSPGQVLGELADKLHDYSDRDYLILTGNPVLIGWTVAIAARVNHGRVKCLQWNGRRRCYLEIKGQVYQYL